MEMSCLQVNWEFEISISWSEQQRTFSLSVWKLNQPWGLKMPHFHPCVRQRTALLKHASSHSIMSDCEVMIISLGTKYKSIIKIIWISSNQTSRYLLVLRLRSISLRNRDCGSVSRPGYCQCIPELHCTGYSLAKNFWKNAEQRRRLNFYTWPQTQMATFLIPRYLQSRHSES